MTPAEEYALEWRRNLNEEINRKNPRGAQIGARTGWDIQVVHIQGTEWYGSGDLHGLFKNEIDAFVDSTKYLVYSCPDCAIRIVHYEDGVPDKAVMSSDHRTIWQKWKMRGKNDPKPLMTEEERQEQSRKFREKMHREIREMNDRF